MQEIKLKGTVEKVALINGKALAQVIVSVPANQVLSIPLGSVSLTIQTLQSSMFNKEPKKFGGSKK